MKLISWIFLAHTIYSVRIADKKVAEAVNYSFIHRSTRTWLSAMEWFRSPWMIVVGPEIV